MYELKLKKISLLDLDKIMKWRMLPEVTKYMYTDPRLTMESQIEWFNKVKDSNNCYYWIISYNNEDIGLLGLVDIDLQNKRCNRIWYIAENKFRSKGLGQIVQKSCNEYVFKKLGLNKIFCEVLATNQKAINAGLKSGMRIEGTLKEHIVKNKEFYDVVIMGITATEWDEKRKELDFKCIEFEE